MSRLYSLKYLHRLCLILALSACQFGEASFEKDPNSQKSFSPNGTVFAYVDAYDEDLKIRENPCMHIIMSWLVFNPNDDLASLPGSRLEDMRHEIQLRDLMTMHFFPNTEATKGSQLESVLEESTVLSDGRFLAHVMPEPEILDQSATFDDFVPMGSLRSVEISIDDAGFTPNQSTISGRLAIDIQRTINDPEDALIRTWSGAFAAPVIEERLAEKNVAILGLIDLVESLEPVNDGNIEESE